MNPLVSVIMPVKNGENYLSEALSAIKAQNVNMEIIVVNDASTDNSKKIAESFGCVILQHETCKGLVTSKNTALKIAKGKYVIFHDHDDLIRENSLTKMLQEFAQDDKIFAVMAKVQDFFCETLPETERKKIALRTDAYFGLFSGAILMKRELFEVIGLFDENLQAGDIIEWKAKVDKHNLPIKKLDFISCNRRIHNCNYGRINKDREFKDYATILRAKLKK